MLAAAPLCDWGRRGYALDVLQRTGLPESGHEEKRGTLQPSPALHPDIKALPHLLPALGHSH